jgi:aquaporin Z
VLRRLDRKIAAEFVGTFTLVFFGVSSAVFALDRIGPLGVALTFGFLLVVLVYAIGPVSGCHLNPAVTLGLLLRRRIGPMEAVGYVLAQLLGGLVAAGLLKALVEWGDAVDKTGALGTSGWGTNVNAGGAIVVEALLTALLVLVVLLVTGRAAAPGFAGIAIGLTLVVIHLIGIPLTGASVNPARSIGPAVVEGGAALSHLWLYIVAPLLGGALAAAVWPVVRADSEVDAPPAGSVEAAEGGVRAPGRASAG